MCSSDLTSQQVYADDATLSSIATDCDRGSLAAVPPLWKVLHRCILDLRCVEDAQMAQLAVFCTVARCRDEDLDVIVHARALAAFQQAQEPELGDQRTCTDLGATM